MSKRATTILSVLLIIFVFTATNVFSDVTVFVPECFIGEPGATIEIPVSVDDATGTAGAQFLLNLDENILRCMYAVKGDKTVNSATVSWIATPALNESCVDLGVTEDCCGNGGDPEGVEYCDDGNLASGDGCNEFCNLETPPFACAVFSLPPKGLTAGSGSIFKIVCEVIGTTGAYSSICLDNVVLTSSTGVGIPAVAGPCGIFEICVPTNQTEISCNDGLDDDCDCLMDCDDPDCASDPICAQVELDCFDDIDNDGDGDTDCADSDCDGAVGSATTCGVGACAAEGQLVCQGGAEVDTCTPGPATTEICDNIDNDCDGSTDEDLTRGTTCGVGACAGNTGIETCTVGVWGGDTCNPFAGATTESCDNIDNDCDGSTDEDLTRGTTCGVGACAGNTGTETCTAGVWGGDSCNPLAGASAEVCDGIDNDCDGQVDEDGVCPGLPYFCDKDNDTHYNAMQDGTCIQGSVDCPPTGCLLTAGDDCNDNDNSVYPGASDNDCDGVDQNCSGTADEDYVPTPTICGLGVCAAEGEMICVGGRIQDTCQPGTPPETPEMTCNDGLDNDCDGLTDCADPDCECGEVLPAEVNIDPNTLNVKSLGKVIAAYIKLIAPNTAGQIDPASVMLKDGDVVVAMAMSSPVGMSDSNALMVKFDRAMVVDYLKTAGKIATSVEFTIAGSLMTGESFAGTYTVKVISPGK